MTPALLTDQLARRDETIRGRSAECLGNLGPRAAGSVPALMAAVANVRGGPYARYHAAAALGRIGPAALRPVPVLEAASKDTNVYVRNGAVESMRLIREGFAAVPVAAAASPGP